MTYVSVRIRYESQIQSPFGLNSLRLVFEREAVSGSLAEIRPIHNSSDSRRSPSPLFCAALGWTGKLGAARSSLQDGVVERIGVHSVFGVGSQTCQGKLHPSMIWFSHA